ncbi:MAG: acyltransferase [Myxococcota bacterium]|nr:acyltransferase [Myxococcota bacterium]
MRPETDFFEGSRGGKPTESGALVGNSVHFPGLNGIRFFAAFAVMVSHLELFKESAGLPTLSHVPFFQMLSIAGVECFFTLSGFLITYLLLEETGRTGTIQLGKFYMRRILRIWPLFYLVLVCGFVAAIWFGSDLGFRGAIERPLGPQVLLYALLLPNLSWQMFGSIPFAGVLWTVGVEEQFYLLLPVLLRRFRRHPLALMVGSLVLLVGLRAAVPAVAEWLHPGEYLPRAWDVGLGVFSTLRFECMAMGGIAAYFVQRKHEAALKFLHHPGTQLYAIALIALLLVTGIHGGFLDNAFWGCVFGIVVVNVATNPKSLIRLDHPILDYLGKISFGIYVYHSFAIGGCLLVFRSLDIGPGFAFNMGYYLASVSITIALAAISYRFYEARFLRLKVGFTVVESRGESR